MLGGLSKMIAQQVVKSTGNVFDVNKVENELAPYVAKLSDEIGNVEQSKELLDYTLNAVDGVVKYKPVSEMHDPAIDPDRAIVYAVEDYIDGPLADMDYRSKFAMQEDLKEAPIVSEEDMGLYNYILNRVMRTDSRGMLTSEGRDIVARRGVQQMKGNRNWNILKENMPMFESQEQQRMKLPPVLQGDKRDAALEDFLEDSLEKGLIFRGVSSTLSDAEYDLRYGMPDELGTHYGSLGQASYFALKGIVDSFPDGQIKAVADLPVSTNTLTLAKDTFSNDISLETEILKEVSPEAMNALFNNIEKVKRRERLLGESTEEAAQELMLNANEAGDVISVLEAKGVRPSAIQPGYVRVTNPLEIGVEGGAWRPEVMFYELFDPVAATNLGGTEFAITKIVNNMEFDLGLNEGELLRDSGFQKIKGDFFKYYERINAEVLEDLEQYRGERSFTQSISDDIEIAALNKRFMNWIESYGYDSIRYKNAFEPSYPGESDYSYILFRPEQFKSVFARGFDPKDKRASAFLGGLLKKERPAPDRYVVKRGDTLTKIAEMTGMPVEELQRINEIEDVNRINVGQSIRTREPVRKNQVVANLASFFNPLQGDKTNEDYDTEVVNEVRKAARNAIKAGRMNIDYEDYKGANVKAQAGSPRQRKRDNLIRRVLMGNASATEQAGFSVGGATLVVEDGKLYATDIYDFDKIDRSKVKDVYSGLRYAAGMIPGNEYKTKLLLGSAEEFGIRQRKAKGGRVDKKKMKCNKPKRTPSHPKKSHVVKACEGGKEKVIRFGEQGAKTAGKPKAGESARMKAKRKSFKARHRRNIKRGKMSAAYWADKVKW